ncbi:hypothetical protein DFQ01_107115 [Paenibacillus cellulosilyticus]|uniref:Phosphotransferase family enzyme n=1 Tax=Paenibacillus cellulosilyticus TaxID=375489 RepID=A0A2V2YUF0_9BACL|nr:hypothetical protein [Paenibacillus cellulosilyticus]PWW03218.1 hypothetical protein DFQ01_107115 [Paenibacillus cellulosilyticus]
MKARYFNSLKIHSNGTQVTKTSDDTHKLIDEIVWYLDLPDELKCYIPKVHSFSLDRKVPSITLDFVPGGTLGDALVAEGWTKREWDAAFRCLRQTLEDFASFSGNMSKAYLYEMYIGKTRERMDRFLHQCEWARQVHARGYFWLNGKTRMSPTVMLQKGTEEVLHLLEEPQITVVHGDFCLSNLFYSPQSNNMTAIDPRGSFGIRTIYGDHRYDWAKLRHSLTGYEHIVRGKFDINVGADSIDLRLELNEDAVRLRSRLDSWLQPKQIKTVRIIEALLFLSMLPLHKDTPDRQLAFFALGTELLEQALSE